MPLNDGDRVVITGGPWPERRGECGVIVGPPSHPLTYPWTGLGKNDIVVKLDDDPLAVKVRDPERPFAYSYNWEIYSCVLHRNDVEPC